MNEKQSRLDKDLKAIGDRMADVEIAVQRSRQSEVNSQSARAWTSTDPGRASMPGSNSYSSSTPAVTPNV